MASQDLFIEIGCEELPAKQLGKLAKNLEKTLLQELCSFDLQHGETHVFYTPRRLAILVEQVDDQQAPQVIERHGPFVKDAYDKSGTPTLACIGFARSSGIPVDQLQTQSTPKGDRVYVKAEHPGKKTTEIIPEIIHSTVKKTPLPKTMRWDDSDTAFLRPVRWLVVLFGHEVVPMTLFGCHSSNQTYGHRFHHNLALTITNPRDYNALLYTKAHVMVDPEKRKLYIRKHIEQCAGEYQANIDENLLAEATNLVEWPVILKGAFDSRFLKLPKEVLITSMKEHQKCFTLQDSSGQLKPHFILVSNIESKDPTAVIKGNERVINARLNDAAFFFENDKKQRLDARLKPLNDVVFQKQLGTLAEKSKRVAKLSGFIADRLEADKKLAERAATLSKCDLITEMVYEFPNLQGIMGKYYAQHDGEDPQVAAAIQQHYQPRFAHDELPEDAISQSVSLADRCDTLCGIIGINRAPTGDKDPFGLRRSAIGLIRICIEKELSLNLMSVLKKSVKLLGELSNEKTLEQAYQFILSRLKHWYVEQGVVVEVFNAVACGDCENLLDFDRRVKAVLEFQKLSEAEALASANKRVSNILKKQNQLDIPKKINKNLFENEAERKLVEQLDKYDTVVDELYQKSDYQSALNQLSHLKDPVDAFFDNVMIMADDKKLRNNRLAILKSLQQLFNQVADISLLPGS